MGLCNIYEYQRLKSIKLSDAYGVQIRINEGDKDSLILYECTSVTLPTIKMKTDVIQYGNNSKVFVYPDYSNIGELELEFLEHYSKDNALCIQKFVDVCLHKLFDDVAFEYKLDDFIYELIIKIYSNNFGGCILEHVFHHLKLSDYTKYDLDYSSAEIAKWSLKFMFMEYFVRRLNEPEETGTPEETEPSVNEDQMEAVKVAEEAGAAAAAARQKQLSCSRGMETPAQNLEMAQDRLDALKNSKPKTADLSKEQAELEKIQSEKTALQAQIDEAKAEQKAAQDAYQQEVDKTQGAYENLKEKEVYHGGKTGLYEWRYSEAKYLYDKNIEARKNANIDLQASNEVVATLESQMAALDAREAEVKQTMESKTNSNKATWSSYQNDIETVEGQIERFKSDYARAKVESMNNDAAYASAQDSYFAGQAHNRSDAVKALEADVKRSIVNMDVVDEYMSDSQFAAEQNARKRAQDSLLHDDVMYNFGNEALAEPPVSNNRRSELVELDALENELDLPSTSETILDNAGISKTTSQIFNFGNEEQSGELKVNPPLATAEQKEQYRKQRQQERLDSIPKLNFTVPSEEKKEDTPAESSKPKETTEGKKQAEQPKSPMDDFNALTRSERILQKTIEMKNQHPEMRDDIIYEKAAAEVDAELGL